MIKKIDDYNIDYILITLYHCIQQYNGEYGGRQVSFSSSEIDYIEKLRYRAYLQERGGFPLIEIGIWRFLTWPG